MQTRHQELFTTVRTEGSVLPPDLLQRVVDETTDIDGLAPADYHLSGERINEAVSRSWNRLQGAWAAFRQACEKLPPEDAGTTVVRERWLLPLFQELGYGRLQIAKSVEIDGKTYPISHVWQHVPIHLVSFRADLDKRAAGITGASRASPHSLVQELLNREEGYLWGFVSNGFRLRILRDNKSLTRQAFVEFDLQAMMDGQVYPDFKLLWLLCHQSRVEGGRPEQCWLEKWSQTAIKQGTRALDSLRDGVQRAIEALGRGFLAHPANRALRDRLQAGTLNKQDYYRQLLRLIYRLLFLFVAEDRGLLFDPASSPKARERYTRFYSTNRLRTLAGKSRGTPHVDLFQALHLIFTKLDQTGSPELGLPALGSFLWSAQAIADLSALKLSNRDLLDTIRELAYTLDGQARRPVDYKNLGAEELGSIYESLLELHPHINADAGTFDLGTTAGHERKTTGSYYTPTSLVNCLLDSALDPVLDEAVKGGEGYKDRGDTAEKRILSLKVCDAACGSGHFLIAAAHRIAKRLAAVRTGDEEPSPDAYRHALRDVIGHCIYGVDINPMAVELCKVSLWMEALEPGKPLSFLDHRIQVGNSLIGTTPALLSRGIPDEAFEPLEGDDKAVCKAAKKQNKDERKGQMQMQGEYARNRPWEQLGNLAASLAKLDAVSDETIDGVRLKQRSYEELVESSTYETGRLLADAWCAAFVWKQTKEFDYSITESVFRRVEKNPRDIAPWMRDEIQRLARQYQFFHWHLAFPDVFRPQLGGFDEDIEITGWQGGFDVLIGNPPWEMPETNERSFFSRFRPDIATEVSAQRRWQLIEELQQSDELLWSQWNDFQRLNEATRHFISSSGSLPCSASGRLNYYKLFVERNWQLSFAQGRVGMVIPSGIATNVYEQPLWHFFVNRRTVVALFDFENAIGLFPEVDSRMKFTLFTLTRASVSTGMRIGCWLEDVAELSNPERTIILPFDELRIFSPESLALPQFRSNRDLKLLRGASERFARFVEASGWRHTLRLMFSSSDAAFAPVSQALTEDWKIVGENRRRRDDGEEFVPVYEGKMVGLFDHRQADIYLNPSNPSRQAQERPVPLAEKFNPTRYAIPQHWLIEGIVRGRRGFTPQGDWTLAFCDVTSATNERTSIPAILPLVGLTRSMAGIYLESASANDAAILYGLLSSMPFDYLARLNVATNHLTQTILDNLPVPPLHEVKHLSVQFGSASWAVARAVELAYTSWDLLPFARECGYDGSPFHWDETRRFQIRCELDAACFHLYGISRDDAEYILETFPIVKRKDTEKHGTYRTKDTILAIYDAMTEAKKTGGPYETLLNPPPGPPMAADGTFAALPDWPEGAERPANWPTHIHPPHRLETRPAPAPAAPAVFTGSREDDDTLIVRAFLDTREGYSPDYVVACPEANARFLQRARKLGVGGADADINHLLLNARKASKLKGHPTEIEYRLSAEFDPYVFASEWAIRHVQRLLLGETDRLVTLDDILCDPSRAARFDEVVTRIKPGFAKLDYRWAALAMRKKSKSKPAPKSLKVDLERQMTLGEMLDGIPSGPGLYMIGSASNALYVNHAENLRDQIDRHKELAGDQLVPEWLLENKRAVAGLTYTHLAGIQTDRLKEVRISSVAKYRPWLNLLDLEGAA